MSKLFCIDFGSGYTKVALRTTRDTDARLLDVSDQLVSYTNFTVPTLVLVDQQPGERRIECGLDVLDRQEGGSIQIFRNWKQWLFHPDQTRPTGFRALFASPQFAHLAQQFQVSPAQVGHLRQLIDSAHGMFGVPQPTGERRRVNNARILTEHFFRYLRGLALAEAVKAKPKLKKIEEIPVVISVPAFGTTDQMMSTVGVENLLTAARKAGWVLREPCPIISEPFANAIGLLTEGRNRRTSPPHGGPADMDFRGMCREKSPIITAMKEPNYHQPYRALVVDIGAFTTDVALLTYDCREHTFDVFRADRGAMRMASERVGVADLDQQVAQAVPPELRQILSSASAGEWDRLRRIVYSGDRAGTEGGLAERILASSREAVGQLLRQFCERVAEVVAGACAELPEAQMQEVYITGGGSHIPAVCRAVESSVTLPGHPPKFVSSPVGSTSLKAANFRSLDSAVYRGATALGGASTYFDPRS